MLKCPLDPNPTSLSPYLSIPHSLQASLPSTTLGAPWGRGCPMQPQKHGRSCRTSSTLQHHSPGGCSGDCYLQLNCRLAPDGFWAGAIWYTTRRRRCQAPALRRARHPEREGRGHCRRFSAAGGPPWEIETTVLEPSQRVSKHTLASQQSSQRVSSKRDL
jgi:hypothetical protein